LYISDSAFFLDASSIITSGVQENLDLSWLTKVKVQAETPILEKLMHDSEQDQKIKKLEKELFEQKMLVENLKRNMAEQKEEFRAREETQARRSDALEEALKKQSEVMTAVMKEMMEMMKKQAQP
jgi:preprotein translocase subunit SecF